MKNSRLYLSLFAAALVPVLMETACSTSNPTTGGSSGTAAAVTITATGGTPYNFTPASVTITHGQSVQWSISSIHTLNIDNGSGTCMVSGINAFPYTFTFSTAGSYNFHCGVHSSCGNGMCPNPSTCSGMVGTVMVN